MGYCTALKLPKLVVNDNVLSITKVDPYINILCVIYTCIPLGQEVLEVEKKPPQIPTAAYVEMETSTITKSKETRALPPLLTKRAFSLNKIHTKDLQKDDHLPATLRDDSALVGKSIPPISSVIGRGKVEILKREEEKEISDEEKSKPLLRGSLRSLRDAEEGRPQDQEK